VFGRWKNQERSMEFLSNSLQVLRGLLLKLGPYALIEIVLPGGTLLALLLYVYRAYRRGQMSI
jgi:hypothetical protein